MRYMILGTAQALDEQGTPVPLAGARLRALLTGLALRPGSPVPVATLIDEVWGENPPHDAPAALQALVGRLRRALGHPRVISAPGAYRLAARAADVDLFRFGQLADAGGDALAHGDPERAAALLRDALALWRGPALADLPDRSAAVGHEARRVAAVRTWAAAELATGRPAPLVPELTALTAAHPYDEPLRALLIRALRADGRHADALAAYEDARRVLADGLGTDPGPELRALHAELLSPGETGIDASAPPVRVRRTPGPSARGTSEPVPRTADTPSSRTQEDDEPQGNLRPRLTSFVGREPELDAIRSDLRRARLVTLTGPGGSGKTRLAEEAAAGHPRAWLAELAPLDRPEAVPGAVVSALGLRETVLRTSELAVPQDDPGALLVEFCAARDLLLILDNCEHVIDAAARLAETLLTRCPGLRILATSREPLGVPGESVRPVEPLPPAPAQRLFTERARAVRPDFSADADAAAVDEICRRLDGLPLAIELAAARLRLLTPRQIAARLDDRFRLLTSGSRTVLPRQQTLRAVVDWSWDLLDERERTVLCEVSVFAGGWDLAAAEAVCTGPADGAHGVVGVGVGGVLGALGALVDKSLVVAAPGQGPEDGMRYRMLETIAEYAAERAAREPALLAAAQRRHSTWVRAFVERADPLLRSADQLPWIRRLETELDNIRAVLDRAVGSGDEELAAAVALRCVWFWWLRNYRREGVEWIDRVLGLALHARAAAHPAPRTGPERDQHLVVPGIPADGVADDRTHPLYWPRMQLRLVHLFLLAETRPLEVLRGERVHTYMRWVRSAFEEGGPQAARFPGLVWPFTTFVLDGVDEMRAAMDTAVENCRRFGGPWETGVTLMFRAHMAVDLPGGLDSVDDDLAELRELSRAVGDRWMRAQVCSARGEADMARGRFDAAGEMYEEALRLAVEVGAQAETPFLLTRLAEIAFRSGDRASADARLERAGAAAERHGVTDSRSFVLHLRAVFAQYDGDTARAREWCDAARASAAAGTPPPQFTAALDTVDARITAAEQGPAQGIALLSSALYRALTSDCAEQVTAGMADSATLLLAELDDLPRTVRVAAAARHWRGGLPRPLPDADLIERIMERARAALGDTEYTRQHDRGVPLDGDGVLAELTAAIGAPPFPKVADAPPRGSLLSR